MSTGETKATQKQIKKGEILMREGENSHCMYWVQSGTLRLYKKKGSGFIELAVIHSGEVVGDMSFLDNLPRSASVEALQDCEVLEIPRGNFNEFLKNQPSWLMALLTTLVKRLRAANNRVRELESSSMVYSDGGKVHEFLSARDILRLCEAMLVSGLKGDKQADGSVKIRASTLHLHAHHILSMPLAKVASYTEILREAGLIQLEKTDKGLDIFIKGLDTIERFLYWLNEEHAKQEAQQINLGLKAMLICDAIWEFGDIPKEGSQEKFTVNMAEVWNRYVTAKTVKNPWEWLDFSELVGQKLAEEIRMADADSKTSVLNLQRFVKLYPMLSLRNRFEILNRQKRDKA